MINYQLLKTFHPFLTNIKFHRLLKFLFFRMHLKSYYLNQFSIMLYSQIQLKLLRLNKMKAIYLHFLCISHHEVNDFLTQVFWFVKFLLQILDDNHIFEDIKNHLLPNAQFFHILYRKAYCYHLFKIGKLVYSIAGSFLNLLFYES